MLYDVVCEDGCGKINIIGLPIGEASTLMQEHIKDRSHKNLSMASIEDGNASGAKVKVSRKGDDITTPAAASQAAAPRVSAPASQDLPPSKLSIAVSAKGPTSGGRDSMKVPGAYLKDSDHMPKKCKHVGTKVIMFGHKQTKQGLIQRYYCYGCGGTFTTPQQILKLLA